MHSKHHLNKDLLIIYTNKKFDKAFHTILSINKIHKFRLSMAINIQNNKYNSSFNKIKIHKKEIKNHQLVDIK